MKLDETTFKRIMLFSKMGGVVFFAIGTERLVAGQNLLSIILMFVGIIIFFIPIKVTIKKRGIMKYGLMILLFVVLIMPSAALIQTNIEGNYTIVLSTFPDRLVVNTPVHMELHIQNMESGGMLRDLDVDELIVHMQEHIGVEPHTSEENLSEVHKDIPHKTLLDMKRNPKHIGHYHANYTFKEQGLYEIIVQFKSNDDIVHSIFSIDVKPEETEREPLKLRYNIFGIIAASVIVLAAIVYTARRIVEIYDIK